MSNLQIKSFITNVLSKNDDVKVLPSKVEMSSSSHVIFSTKEMNKIFAGLNPKWGELNDSGSGSFSIWAGITDPIFLSVKFAKAAFEKYEMMPGEICLYFYAKNDSVNQKKMLTALKREGITPVPQKPVHNNYVYLYCRKINNFEADLKSFIDNELPSLSEKIIRAFESI